MNVSPSPPEVLVSGGWLSRAEGRDPLTRVESLSCSHRLYRVTSPDGRTAVVKYARDDPPRAERDLTRELFVYRMIAWTPALASVMPKPILLDENRQIIAMESFSRSAVWPNDDEHPEVSTPWVASELGKCMALWHRCTQDTALWPSMADGVLRMPDAMEDAVKDRPESTRALMRRIAADSLLAGVLRETGKAYSAKCLIHGDIRRGNRMVDRGGTVATIKVLDWELAGCGDPAWDVGSVIAEAILEGIRQNVGWDAGNGDFPSWAAPMGRVFLSAYHAAGGVADLESQSGLRHLVGCMISRLLHVACEWSDCGTGADEWPVSIVLGTASALQRASIEASRKVGSWVTA